MDRMPPWAFLPPFGAHAMRQTLPSADLQPALWMEQSTQAQLPRKQPASLYMYFVDTSNSTTLFALSSGASSVLSMQRVWQRQARPNNEPITQQAVGEFADVMRMSRTHKSRSGAAQTKH